MENTLLFLGSANLALLATLFVLIPKKTKSGGTKSAGRALILDSCALIDGRIVDLAQAGFTPEKLIIPSFIIRELQMLADGNDSQKRERARFGLDIANQLKELARVQVVIDRRDYADVQLIDDKLVMLARQSGAQLYTTDFNLGKVAEVEGVKVLNVNELAQKLKPNVLPGEMMRVKVIQKGSGRGQGVGYAEDGTMVVVEQADRMIGRDLDVVVDRMHNTFAGKMIFAKVPSAGKNERPPAQAKQRVLKADESKT
jgi:uncharacterized protein YacL